MERIMNCPAGITIEVWNELPAHIQADFVSSVLYSSNAKNAKNELSLSKILFSDNIFGTNNTSIDGRKILISSSNTDASEILCICKLKAKLRQVSKDGPNQGMIWNSYVNMYNSYIR